MRWNGEQNEMIGWSDGEWKEEEKKRFGRTRKQENL
jgi:hypothetical protein